MDSYEDVAYLRLKVRQDFARRHVTNEMKQQIRTWNLLDSKLYNHFDKILTKKVEVLFIFVLHVFYHKFAVKNF